MVQVVLQVNQEQMAQVEQMVKQVQVVLMLHQVNQELQVLVVQME